MTGWVLIQVTRAKKVGRSRMQECLAAVQELPVLLLTGAGDRCTLQSLACFPTCPPASLPSDCLLSGFPLKCASSQLHVLTVQNSPTANGGSNLQYFAHEQMSQLASGRPSQP